MSKFSELKNWLIKRLGGYTKRDMAVLSADCTHFFLNYTNTEKTLLSENTDNLSAKEVVIVASIEITNYSNIRKAMVAPWVSVLVSNYSCLEIAGCYDGPYQMTYDEFKRAIESDGQLRKTRNITN